MLPTHFLQFPLLFISTQLGTWNSKSSVELPNFGIIFLGFQVFFPTCWKFRREEQTQCFQKFLSGDIFLYLLNAFANAQPQIKAKIFKNCISILAIVNYRNWLDDLLPLKFQFSYL